jgi:hypothetical protein
VRLVSGFAAPTKSQEHTVGTVPRACQTRTPNRPHGRQLSQAALRTPCLSPAPGCRHHSKRRYFRSQPRLIAVLPRSRGSSSTKGPSAHPATRPPVASAAAPDVARLRGPQSRLYPDLACISALGAKSGLLNSFHLSMVGRWIISIADRGKSEVSLITSTLLERPASSREMESLDLHQPPLFLMSTADNTDQQF